MAAPLASISGRTELQRKLKLIPEAIKPPIKAAIAAGAEDVSEMQRRLVVERSGDLRESIVWRWGTEARVAYSTLSSAKRGTGDPSMAAILSAGNVDVRYAHLVEHGTAPHPIGGFFKGQGLTHPGTAPRPFFFPPYRAKRRAVKTRITRAMTKALREVARR